MIPPMPGFMTLRLSTHGSLAVVHLARPDRGNPVDARFLDELDEAAAAIAEDASLHVVHLSAEGGVFSRGWSGDAPPLRDRLPFRCLELLPQPVVASIDGDALGAGLELALACDIRIAGAEARFAMPEAAAGGWFGGTQRLLRLVGRARAAEMLLLGEALDAKTALAWGLVNHVAADGEAAGAEAERLCGAIASRGPLAVRYAKEAVSRGLDMPLDQALRYETDLTVILQTTADRAEGVRAFLDKRPPRFEGR